jgi:hypothetical protein
MDARQRALSIAKSITKLIAAEGGTSGHVSAASITLPAIAFDAIAGVTHFKKADGTLRLYGVEFIRGKDNEAIRKEKEITK